MLSRTEELILLAVWRLGDDAYGITVRAFLEERAGRDLSIGGVYVPLDRLTKRGLLTSRVGEPTARRGGMAKRYFRITAAGVRALRETKRVHDVLWRGLPRAEPGKA